MEERKEGVDEIRKEGLSITELPSSHDPSTHQGLVKGIEPVSSGQISNPH